MKKPNLSPGLVGLDIGFHLAACVLVGYGIGWLIDRNLAWETPWFTMVFVLLGAGAGLQYVVRLAARIGDDDNPYAPRDDDPSAAKGGSEDDAR